MTIVNVDGTGDGHAGHGLELGHGLGLGLVAGDGDAAGLGLGDGVIGLGLGPGLGEGWMSPSHGTAPIWLFPSLAALQTGDPGNGFPVTRSISSATPCTSPVP